MAASIIVAVSGSRTTLIIAEATLLAGICTRIDARARCRWCEARAPLVVDICKSRCSRRQLAAIGVGERVRNRSCLFYAAAGGDRRCGGGGGFATGEQTSTSTIVTHAACRSARSAASSAQRRAAYLSVGRRSFESQFRTVQTPTCCSSFTHISPIAKMSFKLVVVIALLAVAVYANNSNASGGSFKAICDAVGESKNKIVIWPLKCNRFLGQQAQCCSIPALGQAVLCIDPVGSGSGATFKPCKSGL